jgi:hypothetical protein
MLPAPIEHHFVIDGEPYRLVEWTRGGERRLRAEYAMAIAAAPTVIDIVDGQSLYAEAVVRECLKEAPAIFWETLPAQEGSNGQPRRVISCERIPRALWEAFRKEVDAFLALLFPPQPTDLPAGDGPGQGDTARLEVAEAVSPVIRGRAQ